MATETEPVAVDRTAHPPSQQPTAHPPSQQPTAHRPMLSAQDQMNQTRALPRGSSWSAGEIVWAHSALVPQGRSRQALVHLLVGLLFPDETGLPHVSTLLEEAHSRAETRRLQVVGDSPVLIPRVCGPWETCWLGTLPGPFPEFG